MPDITYEVIDDNATRPELEDFIASSANGTLFHSPRFLNYHGEEKFRSQGGTVHHLLFRQKGRICAFIPGMIFETDKGPVYRSPYGGSYGSFVYDSLTFSETQEILELFLGFAREKGISEIHLVPPPPLYCRDSFSDCFQFLFLSKGFRIGKAELLMVCRLEPGKDYPLSAMKKKAKEAWRQALRKGVTAGPSEDYAAFYEMLLRDKQKFGTSTTRTYEELQRIIGLFPGKIRLWLAWLEGRPIAGGLFFLCNERVANFFDLCHDVSYYDFRGSNLMLKVALEELAALGLRWMDFGPSSFGYEPHHTLIKFKESFGGQGVARLYYELKLD